MKVLILFAGMLLGIAGALVFVSATKPGGGAPGAIAVPSIGAPATPATGLDDDKAVAREHLLDLAKRYQGEATTDEQRQHHVAEMLETQRQHTAILEQLLKKDEEDEARYSAILDTWEAQQKQYQEYLDGLKGKAL